MSGIFGNENNERLGATGVGAAVGSAFGPVGTVLGGVAGGTLYDVVNGWFGGDSDSDKAYAQQQADMRAAADQYKAFLNPIVASDMNALANAQSLFAPVNAALGQMYGPSAMFDLSQATRPPIGAALPSAAAAAAAANTPYTATYKPGELHKGSGLSLSSENAKQGSGLSLSSENAKKDSGPSLSSKNAKKDNINTALPGQRNSIPSPFSTRK